ncbi:hypothetical protein [Deinococcus fonticola]|uniref:hypothetical protein n=1 Tax=Deinococcus fonticola TaxID=2528713 RepID=UPI001075531D|nr:hypothetical protein [Deinococcus fonticola]
MKHTAAFTAARDALAQILARPEVLNNPQDLQTVEQTLDALDRAGCHVIQGEHTDLPAPPDPDLFHILPAARDVLGTYAHRELPAWGSAECAQLLAPLCYATQALELLVTLHALGAEGEGHPAPLGTLDHTPSN